MTSYNDDVPDSIKYPALEPIGFTLDWRNRQCPTFDTSIGEREYYFNKGESSYFDLSTRVDFIPVKEDKYYPIFNGDLKNEADVEEFNFKCEQYEKKFVSEKCAQYEKDVAEKKYHRDNTESILNLLDSGYCWSQCTYEWAIYKRRKDIVEKMLYNGHDPDSGYDSDGWTQLMYVGSGDFTEEDKEIIKLLLTSGADPNIRGYRYHLDPEKTYDDGYRSFKEHLTEDCEQEIQDELEPYISGNEIIKPAKQE